MTRVPPMLALVADRTVEMRAHHYEWLLERGYEAEAERALDRVVAHFDRAAAIREGGA